MRSYEWVKDQEMRGNQTSKNVGGSSPAYRNLAGASCDRSGRAPDWTASLIANQLGNRATIRVKQMNSFGGSGYRF
jgi:hypothetical protein